MDLGSLADNVADCGLSQSIQGGLQKNLMTKPKWGSPEDVEAKKGALTADVLKTELGAYCAGKWATKAGESADNFDGFKESTEFAILAKYLCLFDQTKKSPVVSSLFEEQRPLGQGAFGAVYLVFKKDTGAPMATKKMMKPIIKSKNMIHDACIERSVLEKVNSPFLVNLLYAWQDNMWVGLVLTLCPGGDLAFQIGQHYPMNKDAQGKNVPDKNQPFKGFDPEVLRQYIASMAEGLQSMHSAGYVYRDLKPQNMLLDINGQLKMSDMGLVADVSGGPIKQCAGTRGYWSPETIHKEPYTVQPDWWSLGVTAFVLFSDRLPFSGAEPSDMDAATCKGEIDFKHNEPPAFQSLIKALCCVDAKTRLGANGGLEEVKKHEYFAGFDWAALEAGTYKPKLVPDPNEINAPSRDEVAGFKAPDGVVWGDDDQKSFTTWDYAGPYGFQNEAVKMLEKNKELEGGVQTGGGGGCCTIA